MRISSSLPLALSSTVFLLVTASLRSVLALSDSQGPSTSSTKPSHKQSRNKNGRISDPRNILRGGSLSTADRRKKSSHPEEEDSQEIDRYIDFLIATYYPEETSIKEELGVYDRKRTSDDPTSDDTTIHAEDTEEAHEADGCPPEASCQAASSLTKSHRNDIRRTTPEVEKVDDLGAELSSLSLSQQEAVGPASETTTSSDTFWNENSTNNDMEHGVGGGDDDDNEESDTEAELLDQYIEFLQQDYDNDRALDRYIHFLEEDYDRDQALDRYIDFLLTTTASSVPGSRLEQQEDEKSPEVIVASTRTSIPSFAQPNVTLQSTSTDEELLCEPTTPASSKLQQQSPLDTYIDQLVTAVELDEYIDQLVSSVSNRDIAMETDDVAVAAGSKRDAVENAALDSYIDRMAVKLDHVDEGSPSAEAKDSSSTEPSTAFAAIAMEDEEDGTAVPAKAEGSNASDSTSSQRVKQAASAEAHEEPQPVTLDDPDDKLVDGGSRVAVPSVAMGGDGDGDDDADEMSSVEPSEDLVGSSSTAETEDLPAADSVVASRDAESSALQPIKGKSKKKRKKKPAASASVDAAPSLAEEEPLKEAAQKANEAEGEGKDKAPMQAPNGLYRFLLRQGPIGHVLVLALVLVVEWVQRYVPQLAEFLAFLWVTLAPPGIQRSMAPRLYIPGEQLKSKEESLQHLYSGRGVPLKGRQGKKISKEADKAALATLKGVGDVQKVKYRHVSLSFLQRHGLGIYSDNSERDALENTVFESRRKSRSQKKSHVDDDEEDDVDWVLNGLSAEKITKYPVKTSVKVGIGSEGPTMELGAEFGLGDTKSPRKRRKKETTLNTQAITRDSVRKRTSGPRTSDKDGGSGVVGQIRAATSSNWLSRNLLGAYPGDVAPPEEAGAARGVTSLAKKYGYGDWSSDDEDDDNGVDSKKPSRKKKRGSSSLDEQLDVDSLLGNFEDEDEFDDIDKFLGNMNGESLKATGTSNKRKSKKHSSSSASASSRKSSVRHPLELVDETKKTKRKKTKTKSSGIEELEKRNTNSRSFSVKPAMSGLKDLIDRPSQEEDK